MLDRLIRPNIRALKPYRCARDTVQDGVLLDANENPYPSDWNGTALNRYPDPAQKELRRALSGFTGLPVENILAGAGSDEVLEWVFKVFVDPAVDSVALLEPTYGMYRVLADIFGVTVFESRLGSDFGFDAQRLLASLPENVKAVFLCSPNNPTGNLLDRREVLRLCRHWGRIVVVDEAYIEFARSPSLADEVQRHPNLIVLRTLSKAWGQAAIRLGYALADSQVVSCFQRVKAPYNLNALTMRRGVECLGQGLSGRLDNILQERDRISRELAGMPGVIEVFPSQANFVLFRCRHASQVCQALLKKGIVIRDRSSLPGLKGCIRVSVGLKEENDLVLRELGVLLDSGDRLQASGVRSRSGIRSPDSDSNLRPEA